MWTGATRTHPLRHYKLTQADLTDVRELCGFKSIVRPTEVRATSSAASLPSPDCAVGYTAVCMLLLPDATPSLRLLLGRDRKIGSRRCDA